MKHRKFNWLANLNWFLRNFFGFVLVEEWEVDDVTFKPIKHNKWRLMTWNSFCLKVKTKKDC